jgi:hypothetical protein
MKIKMIQWSLLLVCGFILSACSNTGSSRNRASCRNACLATQTLCFVVTTNPADRSSFGTNLTCQLLFGKCLTDCDTSKNYATSRSSSRSSGGSGGGSRGGGSRGGGSGGGSSGGGSSSGGGGGHGGGGH